MKIGVHARWLAVLIFALPVHAAVTFSHDIARVVYQYCATCHRPGEAGPFPLLSYDDVRKHARQIADVTHRRYMPPWLPDPGPFEDQLRLTDDQIRLFAEWAEAGAPQGDPAETPAPPKFTEGWQLGTPDLILEASKPFNLPAASPEVYWNFVFTPNIDTRKWVRAIEIRPGDKRLVHHANLYVDRTGTMRARGEGFPGMDFVIERPVGEPDDGHFLYWKPGGIPYSEPDGFAWRLDPGNDLLLNAHMQPSGKPEQVRPQIGLYFTDHPQTRFPMLVQLEDDGALNIPPGARNFVVSDDFTVPMDVEVLAIYPHAHYLGRLLEAYATLPSGCKKPLIRIQDWDRNWEAVYRYREPVFLPRGSTISMDFHYDNSAANARNPSHPPKRVHGGNTTVDEMGHLWLQVLPKGPRDRRVELEEALLRDRLEKYPKDFEAHLHLGATRLARLDPSGAAAELQIAVRGEPSNPEAHNLLGSAMVALGRNSEAVDQFRVALKLRPEYPTARYNLARALIKSGRLVEATDLYRQVVAAFPDDAQAHDGLGELLLRQRKYQEALNEFDRAIAIDPAFDNAKKDREQALEAAHKNDVIRIH
jgi:tetratricopeptide (TPR) repeat protein